jgi:hypothetical protein
LLYFPYLITIRFNGDQFSPSRNGTMETITPFTSITLSFLSPVPVVAVAENK